MDALLGKYWYSEPTLSARRFGNACGCEALRPLVRQT